MPRRHDDLIGRIAAFDNLLVAAQAALAGKRSKPGPAGFQANLEKHLFDLQHRLLDGSWRPGPYRAFTVHEPKTRMISAAPFADRLDTVAKPEDMNIPGYKFHRLTGDRKDSYAVTVTGNWRITFRFDGEDAVDVDMEDYH